MGPEEIIEILGLKPLHPEGGYYRESYRSPSCIPARDGESAPQRSLATAIYYLLTPHYFSALHRLASDETYHFYLGDPVQMLLLHPDGSGREAILGHDLQNGQMVQLTIPAGAWQGAALRPGGRYALLGTTVSPGFDARDFCLADRALADKFPGFAEQIHRLTR